MRITVTFAASWLLFTALTSAIPGPQDTSSIIHVGERQDSSTQNYGGRTLQSDAYAGLARLGQQTYQATHQPAQWEKCNVSKLIVRREW
jgi:hypothetical protein